MRLTTEAVTRSKQSTQTHQIYSQFVQVEHRSAKHRQNNLCTTISLSNFGTRGCIKDHGALWKMSCFVRNADS